MKILNLVSLLHFQDSVAFDKYKDEEMITISPFSDQFLPNSTNIKCEIGSLSYVLAMISQLLNLECELLSSLDTALLSGESNVSEEECEQIVEFLKDASMILVDDDLINHAFDHENIQAFLGIISNKTAAKIVGLNGKELEFNTPVKKLKELESFDGSVVFKHKKDDKFIGGRYFAMAAKIKDEQLVLIKTKTLEIKKKFILDKELKGTVAFLGTKGLKTEDGYSFEVASIKKEN